MLEDALELAVITYNRADALAQTLEALAASPFASCRLTVLDNHSTDHTPDVCARFTGRFADFRVVRHARNVGAEPNYLRALEGLDKPYGWVLCDDDDLDFSDCQDVIDAVQEGAVDVVSVGAVGREAWPDGRMTMGALRDLDFRVYGVFVFMPNTIWRTAAIDQAAFVDGYRWVENLYPMFPFVRRLVERDAPVHVSRSFLVNRRGVTVPTTPLHWFVRWVRCAATIPEPQDRQYLVYSSANTRADWVRNVIGMVLQEKLYRPEAVGGELWELLRLLRGKQRLVLMAAAPLALLPTGLLAAGKALVTGQRGEQVRRFSQAAPAEQRS